MEKKKYITPLVEVVEMEDHISINSISGSDTYIRYGGGASESGIDEADVNKNSFWDVW